MSFIYWMIMVDDAVERAAKLLLNGASMLHIVCPNCKDPIYKLRDGTLQCPTCMKNVIFESEQNKQQLKKSDKININNDPVENKISQLAVKLENSTDSDEILHLATLIKKLQSL